MIQDKLGNWFPLLYDTIVSPQIHNLGNKLTAAKDVTPGMDKMFTAYELCQPEKLRVLIIGQDPYPTPGQAHGLAFSTANGVIPYSLKNIFADLELCTGVKRTDPNLSDWAAQGVMLLNTCLTTKPGVPFAHKNWGWEYFTGKTIEIIGKMSQSLAVIAWGKPAQDMVKKHIGVQYSSNLHHSMYPDKMYLTAAHPANERYQPGSYIGSRHFTQVNDYFQRLGLEQIKWI